MDELYMSLRCVLMSVWSRGVGGAMNQKQEGVAIIWRRCRYCFAPVPALELGCGTRALRTECCGVEQWYGRERSDSGNGSLLRGLRAKKLQGVGDY